MKRVICWTKYSILRSKILFYLFITIYYIIQSLYANRLWIDLYYSKLICKKITFQCFNLCVHQCLDATCRLLDKKFLLCTEKTRIPFPFTLNGIWSWWQFSFRFSEPNGIPFCSENRKENCHHDHIPFNVRGNGNIVFSVDKMLISEKLHPGDIFIISQQMDF